MNPGFKTFNIMLADSASQYTEGYVICDCIIYIMHFMDQVFLFWEKYIISPVKIKKISFRNIIRQK